MERGNSTKLRTRLTHELVLRLIDYDKITGLIFWRKRIPSDFADPRQAESWNRRWGGKPAQRMRRKPGRVDYITTILDCNVGTSRLIWFYLYGEWPDEVDHIDGNPLNNAQRNLRNASSELNSRNARMQENNISGVTGVHFCNHSSRWIAKGFKNGRTVRIKKSKSFDECVAARKKWISEQDGYTQRHGV